MNTKQINLINEIEDIMSYVDSRERNKLQKVCEFLPRNPVLAVMKAEELGVDEDLIADIKRIFGIVPNFH